MWKIIFHVRRLTWERQLSKEENGNCHRTNKSQEKEVRHKRGNSGPKEGTVSILETQSKKLSADKYVIGKINNFGPKEGTISILRFSHKSRKGIKYVIGKNKKLWA